MDPVLEKSVVVKGMEDERCQRNAILAALYQQRLKHPDQPGITIAEFEQMLGVPKEAFEFSLWYLKEGQFVKRTDNGTHTILLSGVDLAEGVHLPAA